MTTVIAAAGETAKATSNGGLSISLDIAALLHALVWPIVILVIALIYRKEIPVFIKSIGSRLSKLEFAGLSIELAKAKAFVPDWSAGALDLRHTAAAIQVTDSTAATFITQLSEKGDADYAEVNLAKGDEWLTSRLFILAIVFARTKGIRCFVFVETSGGTRNRFVCWATPAKIRWALARRFPWLEQAYAKAYAAIMSPPPPLNPQAFIASNHGGLGHNFSQPDPGLSVELLKKYLENIQVPAAPPAPNDLQNWVLIDDANQIYEHAQWLTSELLEGLLSKDCNRSRISLTEIRSKSTTKQLRAFLSIPDQFVAVTAEDQRFEYLVDRSAILEQVGKQLA